MPNPKATIDIVANAEQFKGGMKGVEKVMDRAKASMKSTASGVKRLDEQFGESSRLKKFLDIGMGAGAVAGIAMASRIMGDLAQRADELAQALRKGEIAAEELPGELLKSLPIVSDLYRAMEAVANIISPIGEDLNKQITAQGDMVTKLRMQVKELEAGSDAARTRLQAEAEYRTTLAEIVRLQREATGAQGENALTAARAAEQAERHAIALRDAKLAAADEAERQPIQAVLDRLALEIDLLNESAEAMLGRSLAAVGATEADIAQALAMEQTIAALREKGQADATAAALAKDHKSTIEKAIAGLHDQARALSLSTEELELWKLHQAGATDVQIKMTQALRWHVKGLTEWRSAQARAKSIIQEMLTPLEKYEAKLKDLRDLHSKGLIDEDVFGQAVARAQEQLDTLSANVAVSAGGAFESVAAAFNRIAGAAASPEQVAAEKTAENTGRMVTLEESREQQGELILTAMNAVGDGIGTLVEKFGGGLVARFAK